ncbi:hypothetical protein DOY81_001347 [Sarcophaga bullata]|nr:hypothetical protein DOY81_001347 [Sarcophaga bullata]
MSRRSTNSGSSAVNSSLTSPIVGDGPRPPPRRRAASVTGQQSRIPSVSDNGNNVGHTPRRSLANVRTKLCIAWWLLNNVKVV